MPRAEWVIGRIAQPRFSLRLVDQELSFRAVERNAINRIGMQFCRTSNAWPAMLGCRALKLHHRRIVCSGIKSCPGDHLACMIGSARTKQEVRGFSPCAHSSQPESCVSITPSEIEDEITIISTNWTQTWRLEGNVLVVFLWILERIGKITRYHEVPRSGPHRRSFFLVDRKNAKTYGQ